MKSIVRPMLGGTNDGKRPQRLTYWRTGYGNAPGTAFWVRQAGEYHTKPGYSTGHFDGADFIQFFYHVSGDATVELNNQLTRLKTGHLLIVSPEVAFTYHSERGARYHWFALTGDWPPILPKPASLLLLGPDAEVMAKFVEIREVLILGRRGYALQAISLVFALLARLKDIAGQGEPTRSGYPDPVRNAMTYLREHYLLDYDPGATAAAAGVSPSHLRNLFQEWVGESPKQFHTYCRLEQAKRLLSEKSFAIAEVAAQVGFTDQRYFSRVFKQATGLSPTDYAER